MGKPRTPGETRRASRLLRLARAEFGRLARAERTVIVAAALGELADFTDKTPGYPEDWKHAVASERFAARLNDARDIEKFPGPICEAAWKRPVPKVTVRPGVVRWLLTDRTALRCVHAFGVRIRSAHVPGLLDLEDAVAARPLWCYACVLEGVLLRGARCRTVGLQGCLVTRTAMPSGTHCAIAADRVEVGGGVFLRRGFRAEGEVRLTGARIAGNLDCDDGVFVNATGKALSADGVEVGGVVFLRGRFRAEGGVRLLGARIAGNLDCVGGAFINAGGDAIATDGARVEGTLFLREIREVRGVLNLIRCRAGYLNDRPRGITKDGRPAWPEQILLTDFRYDGIFPGAPLGAKDRLAWLANHDATYRTHYPDDPPDPQPYRQLAEVLKAQGRESDARRVLFGYEKRRARWHAERTLKKYPKLARFGKFVADRLRPVAGVVCRLYRSTLAPAVRWLRPLLTMTFPQVYRLLVGFGYDRWRALAWLAALWLIGSFVFGYQGGARMQPTQALAMRAFESAAGQRAWLDGGRVFSSDPDAAAEERLADRYPTFNAAVYSLDTLIPLVGFEQEAYWTPRGDPDVKTLREWWANGGLWSGRWWTRLYLVFHISMGWVIATLFAASFTRLMRHD